MECWLKHLVHPHASKPARQGPEVKWTSGILDKPTPGSADEEPVEDEKESGPRMYHTVTSAQGSAVHWQVRVHYYW